MLVADIHLRGRVFTDQDDCQTRLFSLRCQGSSTLRDIGTDLLGEFGSADNLGSHDGLCKRRSSRDYKLCGGLPDNYAE
jgi:hypothetical protein